MMQDSYRLLDVPDGATPAEIRAAYHKAALRWHPDRFPAGPERAWAEDHMAEINAAYSEAMSAARSKAEKTQGTFADVRHLLTLGELSSARRLLMNIATRTAEWNYLFGAVLLRLGEYDKAALYLSVAVNQNPENGQYREVYEQALSAWNSQKLRSMVSKIKARVGRKRP